MQASLTLRKHMCKHYDCSMPTLYVRISDENMAWLRGMSGRSQMSMARTLDLVLDAARQRGWTTVRQRVEVTGDEQPQQAGESTSHADPVILECP